MDQGEVDSQEHMDEYAGIMLDHLPAAAALFDARNLRLLATNRHFYRFLELYHGSTWDAETALGHTLIEWLSAADPTNGATLIAIFRNVAETGIPYQTEEYAAPTLNGGSMHWNWSLHAVRNEHGNIVQLIFHGSDVTLLARQQKNDFLSLASHELRTPVTVIVGFAEILQLRSAQHGGLDLISQRAIAQIVTQSDQLTRLIAEMFDLTRLENAQLSLDCNLHDLHATLKEVIESQEITARGHSIRLAAKGLAATDMVIGYFDKQRVMQIINNLISNAIKYSPDGGEIEVGLERISENRDEALI